mmetsp:Transcript_39515/g.40270  ORF Transcript_39515/g.40270 Transcript_39515/m.40270 type:complete len:416 (+) Transcript_39515:190-1437(+)
MLLDEDPTLLNHIDENGNTPLICACSHNFIDMVKMLLERNPDMNIRNKIGHTALTLSSILNHPSSLSLLIQAGVMIDYPHQNGSSPLILAVKMDHMEIVQTLVETGVDLELRNHVVDCTVGNTALLESVLSKHVIMTRYLLSCGAQINAQKEYGYTALHMAVMEGSDEIVRVLLQYNPDIENMENMCGISPLQLAAREGQMSVLKQLLLRRAIVNSGDKVLYNTPLMYSAMRGNTGIVRCLLGCMCDLDAVNVDGNSALMLAIRCGQNEVVQLLIRAGADIDITNNYDKTAYDMAEDLNNVHVLTQLSWRASLSLSLSSLPLSPSLSGAYKGLGRERGQQPDTHPSNRPAFLWMFVPPSTHSLLSPSHTHSVSASGSFSRYEDDDNHDFSLYSSRPLSLSLSPSSLKDVKMEIFS